MKLGELFEHYESMNKHLNELRSAIMELRDDRNFDLEKAQKDNRLPVKLLLDNYLQLADELAAFKATNVDVSAERIERLTRIKRYI